jgi:hypothetical protein
MPASKEYIKALQIKRLEQSRPKVKLPKSAAPEVTNLSYLFKNLEIAKSSTEVVITPLAVTTTTLDDGRIYLKDAIKYFGWNEFTCLDFQVDSGAVTITAIDQSDCKPAKSQGRICLPLWCRKLLNWQDKSSLLVVTQNEPINHVVIYLTNEVVTLIKKRGKNE